MDYAGDLQLDEKDLAILEIVEQDFDMSLETLASELEISKSAVHYRLNNLRERGVIRKTVADIDPAALGLTLIVISEVSVEHERGYAEEVGQKLSEIDYVQHVYYTMGDTDFVVISRMQTREQMNRVINDIVGIDSVKETSSTFVMDEVLEEKGYLRSLPSEGRELITNGESE
ncbi:Lrp/AsnC family transcriptional regulator (plasmid) [Haloferacaceae archaeon DSL9]